MAKAAARESCTDPAFGEGVRLTHASRQQAVRAVNTELIDLHGHMGEVQHHRIEADGWARGTVVQLAAHIARREPGLRGLSSQNRWRMRQFFLAYRDLPELSTLLRALQFEADQHFKDAYLLEFLALPDLRCEADLHRSLLQNLGRFLTELGRDFCYVGFEYPVRVGGRDFALDLLFFHRGLNCLVAIELKVTPFEPEHPGKLPALVAQYQTARTP